MTDSPYRALAWPHGVFAVQRLGAMLAPVTFVLADGRQVSPMHIAPWAGEPGTDSLPGILRRLRGEWPCVPFGYSVPPDGFVPDWAECIRPAEAGEEVHGHSSNHDWRWEEAAAGALRLSIDYPEESPASNDDHLSMAAGGDVVDDARRLAAHHLDLLRWCIVRAQLCALFADPAREVGSQARRHVGIQEQLAVWCHQGGRLMHGDDVDRSVQPAGERSRHRERSS